MVRFGVKTNEIVTSYEFPTVEEAYNFYLENYATEEDFNYYKGVCGRSIYEVTDPDMMEALFRNVFEDVTAYFDSNGKQFIF